MSAQDPRFMQALARALAEMQGQDPRQAAAERAYEQDAARSRQQYGVFNDGSPNALGGGVVGPGPEIWPNPDYPTEASIPPKPAPGPGLGDYVASFLDLAQPNSDLGKLQGDGLAQDFSNATVNAVGFWPNMYQKGSEWMRSHDNDPIMGQWKDLMTADPNARSAQDQARGEDLHDTLTGIMEPVSGPVADPLNGIPAEQQIATKKAAAKKKGEFSHFFELLKQAKTEGKGGATSKAFKDLAKQLGKESDPTTAQGGTVPVA